MPEADSTKREPNQPGTSFAKAKDAMQGRLSHLGLPLSDH
jgi:hypothetical protein